MFLKTLTFGNFLYIISKNKLIGDKMNKEELISNIINFGGIFVILHSDASDSYIEIDYKGWTIKAAGQSLIDAYKHALDAICVVREDFSSYPPSTIYSI